MPVILAPGDWPLWLDPGVQDAARVTPLLVPAPDGDLEVFPVSRRVNSPANDDPECARPAG